MEQLVFASVSFRNLEMDKNLISNIFDMYILCEAVDGIPWWFVRVEIFGSMFIVKWDQMFWILKKNAGEMVDVVFAWFCSLSS